jgi:dihydroorotase
MELYAEVFEANNALDKLEGFASFFGADFYRLPRNTDVVTLQKSEWIIPDELTLGDTTLVPLDAGRSLRWKFVPHG